MAKELDLFSIRPEDKIPAKGKVLISEPFLKDTFFNRSIVLLTEHNEDGTIGFILNKNLDITLDQTLEGFENFNESLSMGGPVQPDTLHYIHTTGSSIPGSMLIGKGIWWGGDLETIKDLIATGQMTGRRYPLLSRLFRVGQRSARRRTERELMGHCRCFTIIFDG